LPALARPLRLPRDRLYAGDAAREGLGRGCGALSEDGLLAGAPLRLAGRARRPVRRLARRGLQHAPPRERPLSGRAAPRRGAAGAAAAATGAFRLVGRTARAGAGRRLSAPRRLLLPGAHLAG